MTNKLKGTLYTGVTSDLVQRVYQHKSGFVNSFSKKYNLKKLVYYELHHDITTAIQKEKSLKRWRREWKIKLIEQNNQLWEDLFETII